jgi:hypothetical protein
MHSAPNSLVINTVTNPTWYMAFITAESFKITHLSIMQLPINVYLPLSNISSKIRSRMCNIYTTKVQEKWSFSIEIWKLFIQK